MYFKLCNYQIRILVDIGKLVSSLLKYVEQNTYVYLFISNFEYAIMTF